MSGKINSKLDANLILREVFDNDLEALKVTQVSGSLVPEQYDNITLTYVPSGNGVGEIQTVTYTLSGGPVAVLTLSYDSSNRLINVSRS